MGPIKIICNINMYFIFTPRHVPSPAGSPGPYRLILIFGSSGLLMGPINIICNINMYFIFTPKHGPSPAGSPGP